MDEFDVERFIFPDGSERDMIVFEQGSTRTRPKPVDGEQVNVCPICGSQLVHPTDWQREGSALWRIVLRCPNCEIERTAHLNREQVERYNRILYEGTERLAKQADQLARHNFQEEIDKFVTALRGDLILPMDF
jgi:hypothetical protein